MNLLASCSLLKLLYSERSFNIQQTEQQDHQYDMVDPDEALLSYKSQLHKVLQEERCCSQIEAKKLHQWALVHAYETDYERRTKFLIKFGPVLCEQLFSFTTLLIRRGLSKERSWEDVSNRLLHYNAKLSSIKEHILYIDRKCQMRGALVRDLEHLLVRRMISETSFLVDCYKQGCVSYIYSSRDSEMYLSFIYQSIYNYEASKELDGFSPDYELLKKLADVGCTCLDEWRLYKPNATYFDIYKSWQSAQNLMEITGNSEVELPGVMSLFDDDPQMLLKSLDRIMLSFKDVSLLLSLSEKESWKASLEQAFVSLRNVKFSNGDFEQLLQSIMLSEYPSENGDVFEFVISARQRFQQQVKNVEKFHTELINYLDSRLRKNYKEIRKAPNTNLSHSDELWIGAVALLVIHYVPERRRFLQRYLKEGLFRQMLMLNSKYPPYYDHSASLQRLLIEKLQNQIPMEMHPFLTLLNDLFTSQSHMCQMNRNKTTFNAIYLSNDSYVEVAEDSKATSNSIWPTAEFQREWAKQVDLFASEKKVLHGLFGLHSITMSSPFRLPGGMRLTLLVNLTTASIFCLFNEHDNLQIDDMCRLLNTKENSLVHRQLNILVRSNLLIQKNNDYYEINDNYKPTSQVAQTGVIRCL